MFEESTKYDSVPETDPKEIQKIIVDIISIEDDLDGEESNPFKPITIANWNTGN